MSGSARGVASRMRRTLCSSRRGRCGTWTAIASTADLRRAVHQRGAVFESYRKLEDVRLDDGRWRVALDGGRVTQARYLVDATGRHRTLSRRLGARISFTTGSWA